MKMKLKSQILLLLDDDEQIMNIGKNFAWVPYIYGNSWVFCMRSLIPQKPSGEKKTLLTLPSHS